MGSKDLFQDPSSAQFAQNLPFSGPLGLPLWSKSKQVGEFYIASISQFDYHVMFDAKSGALQDF